jgi:hypothetical protein
MKPFAILMTAGALVAMPVLLAGCEARASDGNVPEINTDLPDSVKNTSTDPRIDPSGRAPRCSVKPIYCDVPQYDRNGRPTGSKKEICGWQQSGECS